MGNGTWLSSFLQPKLQFALICTEHKEAVFIGLDVCTDKSCYFQAEHGPDSQVVLVIAGEGVDFKAIEEEISKQCNSLPRGDFASKALNHSFTVFARDMVEVGFHFPVLLFIYFDFNFHSMTLDGENLSSFKGQAFIVLG